jgi:hypothetical protein
MIINHGKLCNISFIITCLLLTYTVSDNRLLVPRAAAGWCVSQRTRGLGTWALVAWLFISTGRDCLCTTATSGLLFTPQVMYEYEVPRSNDREEPKNSKKNLCQCQFIHHKSHVDGPGREPLSSTVRSRLLTS